MDFIKLRELNFNETKRNNEPTPSSIMITNCITLKENKLCLTQGEQCFNLVYETCIIFPYAKEYKIVELLVLTNAVECLRFF